MYYKTNQGWHLIQHLRVFEMIYLELIKTLTYHEFRSCPRYSKVQELWRAFAWCTWWERERCRWFPWRVAHCAVCHWAHTLTRPNGIQYRQFHLSFSACYTSAWTWELAPYRGYWSARCFRPGNNCWTINKLIIIVTPECNDGGINE